jgi:hypothetical protein
MPRIEIVRSSKRRLMACSCTLRGRAEAIRKTRASSRRWYRARTRASLGIVEEHLRDRSESGVCVYHRVRPVDTMSSERQVHRPKPRHDLGAPNQPDPESRLVSRTLDGKNSKRLDERNIGHRERSRAPISQVDCHHDHCHATNRPAAGGFQSLWTVD